jgi:glucose/arabinose dehydrogenase
MLIKKPPPKPRFPLVAAVVWTLMLLAAALATDDQLLGIVSLPPPSPVALPAPEVSRPPPPVPDDLVALTPQFPVLEPEPSAPPVRPFAPDTFRLVLAPVVSGLTNPVFVTNASDGAGRLFVVEKAGVIRVIRGGVLLPQSFLDIRVLVRDTNVEEGMTGLAFHPDFRDNGRLFVAYSARNGTQEVDEYQAVPDRSRADLLSRKVLLVIPHQNQQHFGGMLAFGRDGYLYVSTGDGSDGGSPVPTAQELQSLRGKLLRLDVDNGSPYAIPPDNPFLNNPEAWPEIWAYGLRNPWRFSFDRLTGDLWIGDVGEAGAEEIDRRPATSTGGENYGYDIMEGVNCLMPPTGCDPTGLTLPLLSYGHNEGCAIIGGYVYRGNAYPQLAGAYYYSDYCNSQIWAVYQDAGGTWQRTRLLDTQAQASSFGEDENGELYLTGLQGGALYQLRAGPP